MADRIIPLHCPACGSSSNEGLREHAFGGEIQCKHCRVTSVLVIDNQWHQKKKDEYVCSACGRVAVDGARFCECSRSLIRQCMACRNEFFIGSNVCPKCGWNHSIDLTTQTAQVALIARAQNLEDKIGYGDFQLLTESIANCPRIAPETEAYIKVVVGQRGKGLTDRMKHAWAPSYYVLWKYEAGVYSGWLFSEPKLSRVASWVKQWHSEILKIEVDLKRIRKDLEVSIITRIFGTKRALAEIQALESKLASIKQRPD